ncbi:hypothetical protein AAC691_15565 [Nguyenibacter vanlangensis]|uniref:Uncharacterized protein n=1 Tax=Nguyenibacter vanlangensis TaxID=1216886 RepID=A0ABZ3D275_9PROT
MNPQGSSIINDAYFAAAKIKIEAAETCEEIQALGNELMDSMNAQLNAIKQQFAFLQPIMSLLVSPSADLTKIVTWIEGFISSFLQPYVAPVENYIQQIAALEAAISDLESAIMEAASKIESCTVNLPAVAQVALSAG